MFAQKYVDIKSSGARTTTNLSAKSRYQTGWKIKKIQFNTYALDPYSPGYHCYMFLHDRKMSYPDINDTACKTRLNHASDSLWWGWK